MSRPGLNVAIVGAGIAGSCAAYFLRQSFPKTTTITVYERSDIIGGRIRTVEFAGFQVETGASFLHTSNQVLLQLLNALSLHYDINRRGRADNRLKFGIWDGKRFLTTLPASGALTTLKLGLRYGLSLLRLRRTLKTILVRWSKIYDLLDSGHKFASAEDILCAVGLAQLTDISMRSLLFHSKISERTRRELCGSVLRAIFCQDDSINAFAGAVGLIAVGAVGGKSLAVTGGNNLLCERLLDAAGAELLLGQEVLSVTRAEDQSASLISTATGSVPFDAVILATPVNNGPQTSGFTGTSRSRLDFEIVHVTYVSGILLADFFGFPSANMIPDYIMTTESGNSPFCSIGLVGRSPQFGSSTYRIASREVLSQDLLKQMFGRVDDILRTSWNAFPFLSPGNKSTPFKLDIGLYFTGSMESTVSTLETQVVGSRNVVALMKSDYDFAE